MSHKPLTMRKLLGFTLIELLVVIAIMSILIAISSVSYQRAVKLSRDSKRKTDLEQIRQALETFRSETYAYPTTASGLGALVPDYITAVPTDPKSYTYSYTQNTDTQYTLCAYLESTSPGNCGSAACGSKTCNYKTTQP